MRSVAMSITPSCSTPSIIKLTPASITAIHNLMTLVPAGIMLVMIPFALRGKWTQQNHNFVEGFGLYWHFVDIAWIFLFPMLYLLGLS